MKPVFRVSQKPLRPDKEKQRSRFPLLLSEFLLDQHRGNRLQGCRRELRQQVGLGAQLQDCLGKSARLRWVVAIANVLRNPHSPLGKRGHRSWNWKCPLQSVVNQRLVLELRNGRRNRIHKLDERGDVRTPPRVILKKPESRFTPDRTPISQ